MPKATEAPRALHHAGSGELLCLPCARDVFEVAGNGGFVALTARKLADGDGCWRCEAAWCAEQRAWVDGWPNWCGADVWAADDCES